MKIGYFRAKKKLLIFYIILNFQDSLSKLSTFETELFQLQNTLKKDVKTLRDARKRRGLKSSSTDSGISDSYDNYEDLPDREEKLHR